MNKIKISSKVKSLALLCLYTTIGLGGATIVSSCGSEVDSTRSSEETMENLKRDYPTLASKWDEDKKKLETSVTQEKYAESEAKAKEARDKLATVEPALTAAEKAAAKYKRDAYVKYVMNVLNKLDAKVGITLVDSENRKIDATTRIDLTFTKGSIFNCILSETIAFLTKEKGDVSEDNLFDAAYISFEKLLQDKYLIDTTNINNAKKQLNYANGLVVFINKSEKTKDSLFMSNLEIKGLKDVNGNLVTEKVAVPMVICAKDKKATQNQVATKLTVLPTNSPKDMLKTMFKDLLKEEQKEDK